MSKSNMLPDFWNWKQLHQWVIAGEIPVSVVGKFHLICFQLGQQQHQNLDEYEENDLQHTSNDDFKAQYVASVAKGLLI